MKKIKNKVIKGFSFTVITEQIRSVIQFGGGVILARVLMPEDFGTLAYISSIIGLLIMLRGYRYEDYIVQCEYKKQEEYAGTAFGLQIIGIILVGLFGILVGTLVIGQENQPIFFIILLFQLVSCLMFVFNSVMIKEMCFKELNYINLTTSVVSYGVSISMALLDCGIWSLVSLAICQHIIPSVLKVFFAPYSIWPRLSRKAFKEVYNYGKYGLVSNLSGRTSMMIDTIIINKSLGESALGFFQRGKNVTELVNRYIGSAIGTVSAPTFSNFKQDRRQLSRSFKAFAGIDTLINSKSILAMI